MFRVTTDKNNYTIPKIHFLYRTLTLTLQLLFRLHAVYCGLDYRNYLAEASISLAIEVAFRVASSISPTM